MGKHQHHPDQTVKPKTENQNSKKKPGRPSNIQIQTQFMNLIRDIKLQAINAETELQLQMAFFTAEDEKKSRRKEESTVNNRLERILSFTLLSTEKKDKLVHFFEQVKNSWSFEEIEEPSELPDYLFDDQNDLAYILYHLIEQKKEQTRNQRKQNNSSSKSFNHKIKAEELFFISLLCLNSQQALRDGVLEFILKNQELILNLIRACIQKVKTKYLERVEKDKEKEMLVGQNQEFRVIKQQYVPFQESVCEQSQILKPKTKSKKIDKPVKKQNKKKKLQSESQDEPILSQKQKQQKLTMCFVNYISWSYYYVYPEEQKSTNENEENQKMD